MADSSPTADQLGCWLERMGAGDRAARDELLGHLANRFLRLARKMLKGFPGVGRWDRSSDVCQGAMVRLLRALQEVKPATVEDLVRLSAQQMRRELLDLARRYYGPLGMGTHQTVGTEPDSAAPVAGGPSDLSYEPGRLAIWSELHRQVELLPEKERQVFDLLWYQDMTQPEAAALLQTTDRTIRSRWLNARLLLRKALGEDLPGG
jgi:RNA polymerase sigma-70 factor (ECF subfamily)